MAGRKGGSKDSLGNISPVEVEQEAKISEFKSRATEGKRQLLLRIPKAIAQIMEIKQGDTLKFRVENPQSKDRYLVITYARQKVKK